MMSLLSLQRTPYSYLFNPVKGVNCTGTTGACSKSNCSVSQTCSDVVMHGDDKITNGISTESSLHLVMGRCVRSTTSTPHLPMELET